MERCDICRRRAVWEIQSLSPDRPEPYKLCPPHKQRYDEARSRDSAVSQPAIEGLEREAAPSQLIEQIISRQPAGSRQVVREQSRPRPHESPTRGLDATPAVQAELDKRQQAKRQRQLSERQQAKVNWAYEQLQQQRARQSPGRDEAYDREPITDQAIIERYAEQIRRRELQQQQERQQRQQERQDRQRQREIDGRGRDTDGRGIED